MDEVRRCRKGEGFPDPPGMMSGMMGMGIIGWVIGILIIVFLVVLIAKMLQSR
jgi:uncharacterized membrane protein